MCLYVCSRSMYVCSKSMTGRGFSNIHTCSRGIHTCSRVFFSEFRYKLTWRFLDRASVLFDFFSLDKPVCPKTPLPVMLFWHTRFKNQRKRYPRQGIVILRWVGIAKTLTGNGVLDLSPSPLDDACSTYMHTCSTYMHAQHICIHTYSTYMHTYIPTQLMRGIHMYLCMYVCMYAKLVCMYVRASGSTPPHKSQKIELSFKYWTFLVRNWTHPLEW